MYELTSGLLVVDYSFAECSTDDLIVKRDAAKETALQAGLEL